ncbi:hypothetical protein JTB14_014373 [Gonioctena quinquepunctata]|nr:hypothetical protein JTB14_014373 [Gonioctena quinquepunctata]
MYWPLMSITFHVILILGSISAQLLYYSYINIAMIVTGVITSFWAVLLAEFGQQVASGSERFHGLLQLSHWYRWNRENRRFLLIFLIATKEPLTFNTSGMVHQNRTFIVQVGIRTIMSTFSSDSYYYLIIH